MFPGIKAYQAQYNSGPSIFANLVSPVNAPTDTSNTGSDRFPAAGRVPISGIVNSIQSQFSFQLTANDSASGTSSFNLTGGTIVPEPSSLVLALLGGLGLLWPFGDVSFSRDSSHPIEFARSAAMAFFSAGRLFVLRKRWSLDSGQDFIAFGSGQPRGGPDSLPRKSNAVQRGVVATRPGG